jgi:excisionase family DNA binding protein
MDLTPPRTIQQAADELNVSVHTIRAWVASRRIGYVRLGKSIRIPYGEIHRLLERGMVPAIRS